MTVLCIATSCWSRGRHLTDCVEETCRGCQPHPAADGVHLCHRHLADLSRHAFRAASLHQALATRAAFPSSTGQFVSGVDAEPGLSLDPELVEARDAIYATLVGLCRVIVEERGFTPPADAVLAMARFVHTSALWLAAHPAADEHLADLTDIAFDPRTKRLAYPVSSDYIYLGTCPLEVVDEETETTEVCGARIYRRDEDETVTCRSCGTTESISQWWAWIVDSPTGVTDSLALAAHLSLMFSRPVDPALIRKWASRGRISQPTQAVIRDGKQTHVALLDHKRRALYWVDSAMTYARKIWGPAIGDPVKPPAEARSPEAFRSTR